MERYRVVDIDGDSYCNTYKLEDDGGHRYSIDFEFFDLDQLPQQGDHISFTEKLFYEIDKYGGGIFRYGDLSNECGVKVTKHDVKLADAFVSAPTTYLGAISDEILVIEHNDERVFLKRLYG